MLRHRAVLVPTLIAIAMLGACKDAAPPVPGSLTVTAGDQQSATVGNALPTPPAVQLKDTKGRPMNGVDVTFSVTAGGGSLAGVAVVKTGTDGIARAGTWTLGQTAVPNTVSASAQGLQPVVFTANAAAGAPSVASAVAGDLQTTIVGTTVAIRPAVVIKDNFGNPVPNVQVTFAPTTAGASIVGATATTDANGTATVGGWTIGTTAGLNTMTATASNGTFYTFTAIGVAGPATQMALFAGDGQSISVASPVPVRPAVVIRDQYGNGVSGVSVVFSVVSGGGIVTGATQTTGTTGIAVVGSWRLGNNQGQNTLTAQSAGLNSINFTATATEALVYTMTIAAGNAQSSPAGWTTGTAPTVVIRDQHGKPAVGQQVNFEITSGGGSLASPFAVTDANGMARPVWWRLGPTIGANTVTATWPDLNQVVQFNATATMPPGSGGDYNISVAYVAPPTARQHQAVLNAVSRWQQVIIGDVSDLTFSIGATSCHPAFENETIEDILVIVDFSFIDGPGAILGSASPCLVRSSDRLPIVGRLRLDAADLATMENNNTIDDVVTHEIGHILGLGTLWTSKNLLSFGGTDSTTFIGALAGAAFLANGGATFIGNPVPVENCKNAAGGPISGCGAGTRDGHWREAVLGRELMTGYISAAGITNPLSAITIQSLADIGYLVNPGAADAYVVGAAKPIPRVEPPPILLNEVPPPWQTRTINDR